MRDLAPKGTSLCLDGKIDFVSHRLRFVVRASSRSLRPDRQHRTPNRGATNATVHDILCGIPHIIARDLLLLGLKGLGRRAEHGPPIRSKLVCNQSLVRDGELLHLHHSNKICTNLTSFWRLPCSSIHH